MNEIEQKKTISERIEDLERLVSQLQDVVWEHQHDTDGSAIIKVKR